MTKKSPAKLPIQKFFGKYTTLMAKARAEQERPLGGTLAEFVKWSNDRTSTMMTSGLDRPLDWQVVAEWWPFCVLRQAAQEGDSEGCKRLLSLFLVEMNVWLPKGVLIPFRWKRGRPNETERIYEAWIAKGRPATNWRVCDDLARAFYVDEFAQARSSPILRKRLRDRIRGTIQRHQLLEAATKSASIS